MVQTVMARYKLSWRDQGTRTSKTFLDKIATYAIGKVRRVLLPKLVKRVTKRVTEDGSLASRVQEHKDKKRKRGGIKNQEFIEDIYVKKEPGTSTSTHTTMIEDETSTTKHSSPVSTITSMSQLISPELERCVLEHLRKGGGPLTIGNEDEWNSFKKMVEANNDSARKEDTRFDDNVIRMDEVEWSNNELITEFDKESRNMEYEIEKDKNEEVEEDEVYEGEMKCNGTCVYEMEFTHHKESLRKRYGGQMKCVGEGCGKTLLEVTKTAQAYVCIKCKVNECRNMLCTDCYGSGGRTRRTRQGITTAVEEV